MPSSYFRTNPNLSRDISSEAGYKEALAVAAKPAEAAAKSFAPVRTGAYRDSIRVVIDSKGVRLDASDFKSHWVEWGSVNQPPSAPLRRGVRAAGLRFKEQGP